jgi:DNA invertase Pin-like site-specific DNA recombinase
MILASYIRTSGDKAESTSLESQIERIKAKCLVDGHTISGEFFDKESGESITKRVGFQDALAFIKAGHADGLIVYKLDRFARSLCDGVRVISDFKSHKKALVCVADPIDTTTALGQAFFQIAMVFAELERKTISQRCIQGRDARAAQLRYAGGVPPYGYKNIADGGVRQLVEDDREQQIIDEIRELHRQGRSYYYITKNLNQRGVPSKHGRQWCAANVRRIVIGFSELQHWKESGQSYNYLESPRVKTVTAQGWKGRPLRSWVMSLGPEYHRVGNRRRQDIWDSIVEKTDYSRDYIRKLLRAGADNENKHAHQS